MFSYILSTQIFMYSSYICYAFEFEYLDWAQSPRFITQWIKRIVNKILEYAFVFPRTQLQTADVRKRGRTLGFQAMNSTRSNRISNCDSFNGKDCRAEFHVIYSFSIETIYFSIKWSQKSCSRYQIRRAGEHLSRLRYNDFLVITLNWKKNWLQRTLN